MSELLSILDEQGVPIGTDVPRSEVHKNGLWHGTVHAYVYRVINKKIEILVHLRSQHKDLYPNTWDPVLGGHIQAGITPMQTVVDELKEEINFSVSSDELIVGPIVKADKGVDKEFNHIFACLFPENAVIHFNDNEVQKVQWMGLDEVSLAIQTTPSEWRPHITEFSSTYAILMSMLQK